MNENFRKFIHNSIIHSYKKSPQFMSISREDYISKQDTFLKKIFENPFTVAKYLSDAEGKYITYILYHDETDKKILHYIYTRLEYRNKGYAKNLLDKNFPDKNKTIKTSHYTLSLPYFLQKVGRNFKYLANYRNEV